MLFTFQLLLPQTTFCTDISKSIFWNQKIYFEISVVLDISSTRDIEG